MNKFFWLLFFLFVVVCLALLLWQPTPATPPRPAIAAGQEQRALHFDLGALYERNGMFDQARDEYVKALSPPDDELSAAARAGLERVLAQKRDPWTPLRVEAQTFLAGVLQTAFKVALLIPLALIAGWLIARVGYRSGYTLLPFDDLTGGKNGEALSQMISTTIQQARLIHQSSNANAIVLPNESLPGLAVFTAPRGITLPSFDILASDEDALSKSFPSIDAISFGGTNLPLGQLAATARRWLNTRQNVIAGNLIRAGNTFRLTATLQNARTRAVARMWQESAVIEGDDSAALARLAEQLTYRILFDESTGLRAPTWRALAEFTRGLAQLRAFNDGSGDADALQAARTHFEAAAAAPGNYAPAQFHLGLVYNLLGEYRPAAETFSALAQFAPHLKLEATFNLGVAYYQQFKDWAHERAEREFRRALEHAPADAAKELRALSHCGLAAIYAHRCGAKQANAEENLRQTRRHVDAALAILASPPIQALTLRIIGTAERGWGQIDEAIAKFQEALRLQPNDATTLVNLGIAYLEKNQPQQAAQVLQRATRINPRYEYAFYKLGQTWRILEEADRAIEAFARAPHIADAHNDRGELLATAQQVDAALAEFRAALKLNERLAPAHANLAWWLIESGLTDAASLDEATEHARQAVMLSRDSAHEWRMRDVLARVHISRAQWESAEEELEHSIQLNPRAQQNHYHLAQVFHATGRIAQAREQLRQVLGMKQGGIWRECAERLLDDLPRV